MVQVDGTPEQPERPGVRPEDMRAGHADRDRVLDRLRRAHVEGRLDRAPQGPAALPVARDAGRHLAVAGFGGRHVGAGQAGRHDQRLGMRRLARGGAS